jgi:hypothetical protein
MLVSEFEFLTCCLLLALLRAVLNVDTSSSIERELDGAMNKETGKYYFQPDSIIDGTLD